MTGSDGVVDEEGSLKWLLVWVWIGRSLIMMCW